MARSDIAHYEGLEFWGPYDASTIDPLIASIEAPPDARALDVGCGDGALLLRLALQHGMRVVGIDRSEAALERAKQRFDAAGASGAATWRSDDAATLAFDDDGFDVVAWLGGPFVGGSHASTMQAFARWLRPGGTLLLGQGFWKAPPPAAYLEATGLTEDALDAEETMLAAVEAAGFEILERVESSRAQWDRFEGTIHANHEAHAAAHADDTELQAALAVKRRWHEAQQRQGREVFGFALYRARRADDR